MKARIVAALLILLSASACLRGAAASSERRVVPAPIVDEPSPARSSEVAILAGGCFWGVQGAFQHVNGVTAAVSGYAGGDERTAEYETVSSGTTGHAEAVRIVFDPRVITYGRLLQIFFSVVHDPTTLNAQGPDVGPQYRSAIFPTNDQQAAVAQSYITQLSDTHAFAAPIVTTIEKDRVFYRAEGYHQDYLERHPDDGYIAVNDLPKVGELKRLFSDRYRVKPALVGSQE